MAEDAIGYFNAELVADVALLQQRVVTAESELGGARAELSRTQTERDDLRRKLELEQQSALYYKERYQLLQRQLFGKKSEKRKLDDSLSRLLLLPGFDDEQRPEPPAAEKQETITYTRQKPKPEGTPLDRSSRFPEALRRKKQMLEPEDKTCTSCGAEMTHIIRTAVTEKLCCSRDPFYVQEYHRPVYGCRSCEEVAPLAEVPEVLERTGVDHSVVSYLHVNKFRYCIPLVRQGNMFRDMGLKYSNDALIDWALRGLDLLVPIHNELLNSIIAYHYLVVDDTKLRAAVGAVAEKLPGYRQGALWGLYSVEQDVVGYMFTKGRTHAACREVLAGFQGYLIVDGYDGFEQVAQNPGIELVNCNSHARRAFVRAEGSDKKRAHEALAFYRALYAIEDEGRELSVQERQKLRAAKARPVLDKFYEWLMLVNRGAPPKSPLGKACAYVLKRWKSLTLYVEDGLIPIDTMAVERAFRVIAVGRKNYLHCASEVGAHGAAVGYSLVNTCLLQGVDPFIYLCDVLERVGSCSQHEVAQLLPQNWKKLYLEEATARYQSPFGSEIKS